MAEITGIAWTDSTFNPWIGCTKVGPGCDHCYAEVQDSRKRWGGTTHWGAGVARYRTSASNWAQPIAWDKKAAASGKPWRVFCASLADVFDGDVDQAWRDDLWHLIFQTQHLSWLLVTKRVGNVRRMVPAQWMNEKFPNNIRLLITVCNQEEADRDIPKLLALPCKNGISYEPALGPVNFWLYLRPTTHAKKTPAQIAYAKSTDDEWVWKARFIDWIIAGGESGSKARPFVLGWGKDTIRQCQAAGVPVFFKQAGSNATNREGVKHPFKDRAGADPAEWPPDLRIREFPK